MPLVRVCAGSPAACIALQSTRSDWAAVREWGEWSSEISWSLVFIRGSSTALSGCSGVTLIRSSRVDACRVIVRSALIESSSQELAAGN